MAPFSFHFSASELPVIASIVTVLHPDLNDSEIEGLLTYFQDPNFDFDDFFKFFYEKNNPFQFVNLDFIRARLDQFPGIFEENPSILDLFLNYLPGSIKSEINFKFNATPSKISSVLKKHIKGQDAAIERFALAMYLHLLRNGFIRDDIKEDEYKNLPKIQPFIIGASGSGKTFIIETFCELYGVPFLIFDASTFTPSGYHGNSVSEIFSQLYYKYDGDYEQMSKAIICLDEFDKISMYGEGQNTKFNSNFKSVLQSELLKVIDNNGSETIYEIGSGPTLERKVINTKNITFVFSGACSGLDQIVSQRINIQSIGFSNKPQSRNNSFPEDNDFIKYGFIPELIGRISDFIFLNKHSVNSLIEILTDSASSPLKQYKLFFTLHNKTFELDEEVLQALAKEALKKELGVRGLYKVLNNHLLADMLNASK